ncbi:hypothetical protein BJ912DRAFT_1145603 [Pholiota molesta]|nr:hypothetical protein BJ912DRAFT_1145603 [Pholiota molesta]
MLHMRSAALEEWHVSMIFTALPLLLQTALVFFLVGLFEFSLPLGQEVTNMVSVYGGLPLLFLAATTILPSLQGFSFFCGLYPRKTLPTPCPFKSPQSFVFRGLFQIFNLVNFYVAPIPEVYHDKSSPNREDWGWKIKNRSLLIADHLATHVRTMWYFERTWPIFDRKWLSLRDACHQRIFDKDPDLYQHRTLWDWEDSFPLSDVTQYLLELASEKPCFKHTESFLGALVHGFNELAESIWITNDKRYQRVDRRSNYFENLQSSTSCSLSNLLLHGGIYKFDQLNEDNLHRYLKVDVKLRLFSTDQTMLFLTILSSNHYSPALLQYYRELWMRMMHLIGNIAPLTPAITNGSKPIPITAITEDSTVFNITRKRNDLTPGQQYSNTANILSTIFQLAASRHGSQDSDRTIETIITHPDIPQVLSHLASRTNDYLEWAQIDNLAKQESQDVLRDIEDQLTQLAKFITNHLNARSDTYASLDILFYLASIFSWYLLRWSGSALRSHLGQPLRSLLNALHQTWTAGRNNNLLEKRFEGDDLDKESERSYTRFSTEWWNQIFKHLSDPHTIAQGSNFAAERSPDARPDPLTQLASPPENETEDAINPLVAPSPGNLYHSPESNTLDSDAPPASAHPDPHPQISGHEPAPISVSHEDASIPHSQPDLPTILHHPRTSAESARTINDLPLPHARSSSNEPDDTRPSGDDNTTAGAAPPSPSVADPDGPQQAAGSSRRDERDLHTDALHLAIDVGPPTSSEHAEAETPGAGGDRSLDEANPEDAVILSPVSQPRPSAVDSDGVVPQQPAGNQDSRSDEQDLQHLAIDVGPPTSSEHVDAETPSAGGDRSLNEMEPEDAVIRVESPI